MTTQTTRKFTSPAKAIRHKCLDCSGDLWGWRFGKRPTTVLKAKPWLLDPDITKILGEAEGCRELHHETGEQSYLARFLELVALAIAKYPGLASERHTRIKSDADQTEAAT